MMLQHHLKYVRMHPCKQAVCTPQAPQFADCTHDKAAACSPALLYCVVLSHHCQRAYLSTAGMHDLAEQ